MLLAPFAVAIVAALFVFIYLTVQAIARAVCEASKHRADADLKIALAQRGMSAAEIERVVSAKPGWASDQIPYASDTPTPSTAMPPHKEGMSPR